MLTPSLWSMLQYVMQVVLCLLALAAVHAAAQPFMPGQGLLPLGDLICL